MIIENLIKAAFAVETANTKRIAGLTSPHDPFRGHRPGDEGGKSQFRGDDAFDGEWVKPHHVEIVSEKATEKAKIITCRIVGVDTEPPCSGVEAGYVTVGTETVTVPTANGSCDVDVKTVHGCRQFVAVNPSGWELVKDTVEEFTVILTLENLEDGTRGWCLASAFPGRPGTRAAERFEEGAFIALANDMTEGYVNGERVEFDDGDFNHVVL